MGSGRRTQILPRPDRTCRTTLDEITAYSYLPLDRPGGRLPVRQSHRRAMPLSLTASPAPARRYSAIDMSTFEALKQAYQRSTGTQEPGVLALLALGSISGSVGATSVYPLNLVRTRLQASGSSGHPQTYTGPWDVAAKTWAADGWRGFYRGLFPTLAKVRRLHIHCCNIPCQLDCRLFLPCLFLMSSMSIQNEGLLSSYALFETVAHAHT